MPQPSAEVSVGLMVLFIRTVHLPKVNQTDNVRTDVLLRCLLATIVAVEKQYSECVSVALGIQHAMLICHNFHLCPASLYHISPHYLINGTIFKKKKL